MVLELQSAEEATHLNIHNGLLGQNMEVKRRTSMNQPSHVLRCCGAESCLRARIARFKSWLGGPVTEEFLGLGLSPLMGGQRCDPDRNVSG